MCDADDKCLVFLIKYPVQNSGYLCTVFCRKHSLSNLYQVVNTFAGGL